jgi:hypothetical protein
MLELWATGTHDTKQGARARRASVPRAARRKLRRALGELMLMNPEFRRDTTRLFLTMFGRPRRIEKVLEGDPLELLANDEAALRATRRLVRLLSNDVR